MKKHLKVLILFFLFCVVLYSNPITHLSKVIVKLNNYSKYTEEAGYKFDKDKNSIVGYFIKKNIETGILGYDFSSESEYLIIATGSEDNNISIKITDSTGKNILIKSEGSAPVHTIFYKPASSSTQKIFIKNHGKDALVVYTILKSDTGYSKLTLNDMFDGLIKIFKSEYLSSLSKDNFPINELVLFGGLSTPKQGNFIQNNKVKKSGKYSFTATGSFNVSSIQIEIIEQKTANKIEGKYLYNITTNAVPVSFSLDFNKSKQYVKKYENQSKTEEGLGIIYTIFTKK